MMKKSLKILSLLTAAACAAVFSACTSYRDQADWENTLPSAQSKQGTNAVEIITEETKPPISISMPETTTASTAKRTELATTTETELSDTETPTAAPENTLTDIPPVPASDYNSTVTTASEAPASTVTPAPSTVSSAPEPAVGAAASTEVTTASSAPASSSGNSVLEKEDTSPSPYIFNDPISRPYCYSTLSEKKRRLYDVVLKGIQEHKSSITLPDDLSVTDEEYKEIYNLIYNCEHSVFYISTQMKYSTNVNTKRVVSVELYYIYNQNEINEMQAKIDAAASKIIGQITEDMTEYDIVKLFFDSIVSGCVYDLDAKNCRDIYGCLVDGRAVCGGYAKVFSYLCDKVGIQSLTITGDFEDVPHMWNMVKIGGEWYHIDVTSGYVNNSAIPYIRYDYFCVDDAIIKKAHTFYDQTYSYPSASSMKYNYYVYNGLVANSYESAYKMLVAGVISAAEKGERMVQILCADDKVFEETAFELFDKSRAKALNVYDEAYDKAARKYNRESLVYNKDSSTGVIKLFIEYLD